MKKKRVEKKAYKKSELKNICGTRNKSYEIVVNYIMHAQY